MDLPFQFEEAPWFFPLVDKGTVQISDILAKVAENMGIDGDKAREVYDLYNKVVEEKLKEGYAVEYLGMGMLIPILDEDGNLESVEFEASEEFQKKLEKMYRENPSLN